MKLLVAIANHGTENISYLNQLLAEYKQMPVDVSVVVLSDIKKNLGRKVEVRVGTPSNNPWSLPFAHRALFRERIDDFDYFIYSEDDTFLRWSNVRGFIEAENILEDNEIAGFLRTERTRDGRIFYSTCHSHFRWIPSTVRTRGGLLWAKYSNDHSACFIASRNQIRKTIEADGFPVEPHEGRYDMLCSAATDIYTQGGLERLVCIDRIEDFTIAHLPNKYIGRMGLPANEMAWQIDALRKIDDGKLTTRELLQPESLLPGWIGSKKYHEQPDSQIDDMIGNRARKIFVYGAGDGSYESGLIKQGHKLTVYPLNAVMSECCSNRGIDVLPLQKELSAVGKNAFDAVVIRDILHLLENPQAVLAQILILLRPEGRIIVRVPNFYSGRTLKIRWQHGSFKHGAFLAEIGATAYTAKSLKRMVSKTGFQPIETKMVVSKKYKDINRLTAGFCETLFSSGIYLVAQKK